jgi:hypothetical protein
VGGKHHYKNIVLINFNFTSTNKRWFILLSYRCQINVDYRCVFSQVLVKFLSVDNYLMKLILIFSS